MEVEKKSGFQPENEMDKELNKEDLSQVAGGFSVESSEDEESTMEQTTKEMNNSGGYGDREKRRP